MRDHVWPVVAASVVVTVGLVAVLPGDDEDDPAVTVEDVTGEFLAAFERSRTATFAVDQVIRRVLPDGRETESPGRLVQRPPDDRVVIGLGGATGRRDGRVLQCPARPDGTSECVTGPPAGPYDEEVAAEVAALRRLVEQTYAVAADGDCFELRLRAGAVVALPYGETTTFCFDPETGAPTRFVVEQPEGTTIVEATDVRPVVTDADLRT